MLREVLLGERKEVPPNSVQRHREAQRQAVANTPAQETTTTELPQEESDAAYVSDDEEEPPPPTQRRSPRLSQQTPPQEENQQRHLINLAAKETAQIPHLQLVPHRKVTRGFSQANEFIQMNEWAHEYFCGVIIDQETGKTNGCAASHRGVTPLFFAQNHHYGSN